MISNSLIIIEDANLQFSCVEQKKPIDASEAVDCPRIILQCKYPVNMPHIAIKLRFYTTRSWDAWHEENYSWYDESD